MSILIYTESENGKFKKSSLELASYGRALADKFGLELTAISFNQNDSKRLGITVLIDSLKLLNPHWKILMHSIMPLISLQSHENSVKLILIVLCQC